MQSAANVVKAKKEVLNMFNLCIGGNIFTTCDVCNEKIFSKCLSAEVMKNGRIKSQCDMAIVSKRKSRIGLSSGGEYNK